MGVGVGVGVITDNVGVGWGVAYITTREVGVAVTARADVGVSVGSFSAAFFSAAGVHAAAVRLPAAKITRPIFNQRGAMGTMSLSSTSVVCAGGKYPLSLPSRQVQMRALYSHRKAACSLSGLSCSVEPSGVLALDEHVPDILQVGAIRLVIEELRQAPFGCLQSVTLVDSLALLEIHQCEVLHGCYLLPDYQ
jgi:hypothetical protein